MRCIIWIFLERSRVRKSRTYLAAITCRCSARWPRRHRHRSYPDSCGNFTSDVVGMDAGAVVDRELDRRGRGRGRLQARQLMSRRGGTRGVGRHIVSAQCQPRPRTPRRRSAPPRPQSPARFLKDTLPARSLVILIIPHFMPATPRRVAAPFAVASRDG